PLQQRRRRPSGGGRRLLVSAVWAFPLNRKGCSERPGAVQGAPLGAAQRTLDGEDRSELMDREGKPCVDSKRFLKREQAGWDALNVCQPWFYLRLVAYGFFRLSEGA